MEEKVAWCQRQNANWFRLNLVGAWWDAEQVKNRPAGIDLLYGCKVGVDAGFWNCNASNSVLERSVYRRCL